MRKWWSFIWLFFVSTAQAQPFIVTDETAEISFVTRHLFGRLDGQFSNIKGIGTFNPAQLDSSSIHLSFPTKTITTNDNVVGPDLTKATCFSSKSYPSLVLHITIIKALATTNLYECIATLQVRNITRPIRFKMKATPNAGGYDFDFAFVFRKKDFKLHCGATGKDFKVFVRAYAKLQNGYSMFP